MRLYHVIAYQETGLIEAFGIAEVKEKIFNHFQSCYGNDYNILNIFDITDRNLSQKEINECRLI